MKLHSIYKITKENLSAISNISVGSGSDASGQFQIQNWKPAYEAILILRNIVYYKPGTKRMINAVPQIFVETDSFKVSSSARSTFIEAKNNLQNMMEHMIQLYESMNLQEQYVKSKDESLEGIDVFIPPCNSFNDYRKCIDSIDMILSQCPVFDVKNERFTFVGTDVGSIWLTLAVVGVAAAGTTLKLLRNFVSFLDSVNAYKSHKATYEMQIKELEEMEKSQIEKDTISKFMLEMFEKEKEAVEAKLIQETESPELNGEDLSRLDKCLDMGAKLMDQGVRFISSTESSKEAKKLFDNINATDLSLPEIKIEKLEDKSKKE